MKKSRIAVFLIWSAISIAAVGCGRKKESSDDGGRSEMGTEKENAPVDQTGTEALMNTEGDSSQLSLGSAVEIPAGFDSMFGETDAHGQLEKVIAEYCNVPKESYADVRYYYNYVDLNEDGQMEILAYVLGQGVEGLEGNALLWLDDVRDGGMTVGAVRQEFKKAGAPVYISRHTTQGYRDLIVTEGQGLAEEMPAKEVDASNAGRTVEGEDTSLERTAGLDDTTGENGAELISMDQGYLLLTWKGDKYQDPEEGTALFHLDGYEGTAVLTNDMESDLALDKYHFLGEAMKE